MAGWRRKLDEEQLGALRREVVEELATRLERQLAERYDALRKALLESVAEQLDQEVGALRDLPAEFAALELETNSLIDKALRIERRSRQRTKREQDARAVEDADELPAQQPPPPPQQQQLDPDTELNLVAAQFCGWA